MKKNGVILLFALCSIVSPAQQYFPFIEDGKTWAELYIFQNPVPDPDLTEYYTFSYKLEGDTVAQGYTWKKLFKTMHDPASGHWQQEFCLYREEGSKVYCYCDIIAGEALMYDFSLHVGDSVYYEDLEWWAYVVETDSVEVNGTMRRRIHFDDPAEVWIEGLGSTCRPFQPIEGQFILPGGYSLLCVSNSDGIIFQNTAYSACFVDTTITSVSGNPQPEFKVGIFSNSSDNQIQVSITGPEGIFSVFELFSNTGSLVKQGAIKGNEFAINQEGIKPGIYILRLSGAENLFSRKLEISR